MTRTDKIAFSKHGRVGYLLVNNPERHNAISLDMWQAISTILKQAASDRDLRVLVVTGAGDKAFIAGADISRFGDERADAGAIAAYNAATERAFADLDHFPKPSIAMIRGYCIGGGLAVALGCDLRICSAGARFALPAAKLGLGYSFSGVKRLVDVVGPAFTKEIIFTGRQFDAVEARDMGVVNRVVAEPGLEAYVTRYAEMICDNAPLTVDGTKFIIGEVLKDPASRDLQACTAIVERCFASHDYIEGRNAFMAKRKPVFTGS
jgi:enoyl-CoA hydratase/carnithine racemase